MCARIGMVTGRGLAGALRRKFPRPLLVAAALALLAANTINIGADLSGMADAAEMLTGWNSHFFVVLFGVGIVGVGLLAIPTLAGSAAYAFAETFGWKQGLDQKLKNARSFYGVIVLSTVVGIALDFADVNPVKALYWTAIVNGLLAPFLLVGVLLVAGDRRLMQGQPSSRLSLAVVSLVALLMFGAAAGMFVF